MGATPDAAVRAVSTAGFEATIAAAGGDPLSVLRRVGLTPEEIRDPQGWISLDQYRLLMETAAAEISDDCFGLHVGARFDPRDYGILGFSTLNCPTLGQVLEDLIRFIGVMRERTQFTLEQGGSWAALRFHTYDNSSAMPRQEAELALTRIIQGIRALVGAEWNPSEVHFAHERASAIDDHLALYRCRIRFGMGASRLVLKAEDLQLQNRRADIRLYGILKAQLEELLLRADRVDSLLLRVQQEVKQSLSQGPTLAETAKRVGLSPRTLQRRLQDRGVVYNTIVDQLRHELSLRHLQDPSLSVSEIAFRLGYSEASAFDRAFRRWTGASPMEFRRRQPSRIV